MGSKEQWRKTLQNGVKYLCAPAGTPGFISEILLIRWVNTKDLRSVPSGVDGKGLNKRKNARFSKQNGKKSINDNCIFYFLV